MQERTGLMAVYEPEVRFKDKGQQGNGNPGNCDIMTMIHKPALWLKWNNYRLFHKFRFSHSAPIRLYVCVN
jgi:hypothetical protein